MPDEIYARWRSRKEFRKGITLVVIGLAALSIGILTNSFFYGFLIALFAWFLSVSYFGYSNIWHLGAIGEEKVARSLEKLGNHYHVIHDFHLPGQRGNIDHIVIGQNGIFVVETKNHKGIIRCDGDLWKQEKISKMGTVYEGSLKNPHLQVKANSAILSDHIRQNLNIRAWVNPIIVFANEEADLRINNSSVPVFRPNQVTDYITGQGTRNKFTINEVLEMKGLLKA